MKKRDLGAFSAIALCTLFLLTTNKVEASETEAITNVQSDVQAKTSFSVEDQRQVVTINSNNQSKTPVWSNYNSQRQETGKYLDNNTKWQSFKTAKNATETWYNLGGEQWIDGKYSHPDIQSNGTQNYQLTNIQKNVRINYAGRGKVAVWNSYEDNKGLTGKYLSNGSSWKAFKLATNNSGKSWYNLGGNQWVDGSYITLGSNSIPTTATTNSGLKYQADKNRYVFYKNNQIQKGIIKNGKQTFYTDGFGGIYAVRNEVPVIRQLPELPTGCEMTAVTMMLQAAGVKINKLQVAQETPRSSNGNYGFVGNPYSVTGWWVFPTGIAPVVKRHLGYAQVMTGASMTAIKQKLLAGHAVVVWVANMNGFVNHALTLTGFNNNGVIYYNNPWTGKQESMRENTFMSHWTADKKRALSY